MSTEPLGLGGLPSRPWTHGNVTAFADRHHLAWELVFSGLTVVYVVLALLLDQGSSGAITLAVWILSFIFLIEFSVRL